MEETKDRWESRAERQEKQEAKEAEPDERALAAAAMERADVLTREVKQSKKQMQNILLHMQQVTALITQLRAQLNLPAAAPAASVAQDAARVAALREKIAAYTSELSAMRHDLVRQEMQELQQGSAVGRSTEEVQRLAEERVDAMIRGLTADGPPGFTLVEILVAVGVFLIFALGVFGGVQFVFQVIFQSRLRTVELSLANQEIEIIRNIPYDQVGIADGYPGGLLSRSTNTNVSGLALVIRRTVRFVDDPFDGLNGGNPNDAQPNDYKFIQIDVNCDDCGQQRPVSNTTTVIPPPVGGGGDGDGGGGDGDGDDDDDDDEDDD